MKIMKKYYFLYSKTVPPGLEPENTAPKTVVLPITPRDYEKLSKVLHFHKKANLVYQENLQ